MKMKITLILALLFVISCGKNGSSSGPGIEEQEGYVDINPSAAGSSELMNVTVDVPVQITGDRIQFLRGVSLVDQKCSFQVNANEIWHSRQSGNQMSIERTDGTTMNFRRNAHGLWASSGHNNGMKVTRRLYLLGGRFILNQDCEG